MPALLPFRAFSYSEEAGPLEDLIYIPGEEAVRPLCEEALVQDAEPALYLYRQCFRFPGEEQDSERLGVTGLLDRAAAGPVFVHEGTMPDRLAACVEALRTGRGDPGSLWLWVHDDNRRIEPLLRTEAPPTFEVRDHSGCLHQMWRVTDAVKIEKIQTALADKELFLADGHHRYAAGWNLATIQIRSKSLRTLPSHRLVADDTGVVLPPARPVQDLKAFLSQTPPGHARFGLILPGRELLGIEVPRERRFSLLDGVPVEAHRHADVVISAVGAGAAKMALLVEALSLDEIEEHARQGLFLPPKSTDFYPKLAAGLVIYRHQKESVSPPVPHLPGVR